MEYNWQQPDWPHFRYELGPLEPDLYAFADKSGLVGGMLKALPEEGQKQAILDVMIAEAIKTSEIEGEYLSRPDVTSSIRNQIGLNAKLEPVKDLASKGAAELMVAVRETWNERLTPKALFDWHRTLFQGNHRIKVGAWRRHTEPMQVVSGPIGRQVVHFEAPPSDRVPEEMKAFVSWFNQCREKIAYAPVRAGLVHLYFESIHPFEDGNGRIGRALAEKALSQGLKRPVLLSLSQTIEGQKQAYYDALNKAQRSNEVTPWLQYFLKTVLEAQIQAERQVDFVLRKTRFFDRNQSALSARQLKVVRRMLDEGADGFKGGINASKYANLTRASKATATRDLQDLLEKDVLVSIGGGRSTRYELNL
ncbi:MAG: Fic family protein [Oceanipulchritudo sp.]